MPRKDIDPYDVIRRLRYETDTVAVGFSCGKDSVACLDLCCQWFNKVIPYYMYVTPKLSFHMQYIKYVEDRYGVRVLHVPHWVLSRRLSDAALRPDLWDGAGVPRLGLRDVEVKVFKETGVSWFAYGVKKIDSLERRAMLNKDSGIILVSHRGFPLAEWGHRTVTQYLRNRDIPLSPEYAYMGRSYGGGLEGEDLVVLKQHYPEDYQRVLERFPFAEAEVYRHENGMTGRAKVRAEA